jgi:hypothetical protein
MRLLAVVLGALGSFGTLAPFGTPGSALATDALGAAQAPGPIDLLVAVDWLAARMPNPCGDGEVDLVAGSAIAQGIAGASERIVLRDVRPLDPTSGTAVVLMSCQPSDGVARAASVAVVRVVGPDRGTVALAERGLPADGRVVTFDPPTLVVEVPEGASTPGACCAPFVRRLVVTTQPTAITVVDDGRDLAFARTLTLLPALSTSWVRASRPAAALCFRWGDSSFYAQDPPTEPEPPRRAVAEVETLRLALVHITGRWIAPSSTMTPAMADVVRTYQTARDLQVDGVVGPQTAAALAADLGCPPTASFRQIDPPALGPRRFASPAALAAALTARATSGTTGNPSLDALLATAGWHGEAAMFLGCARRDSPASGVTCSWSGVVPLQLVGLVDDPSAPGVGSLSVLYARSAAP